MHVCLVEVLIDTFQVRHYGSDDPTNSFMALKAVVKSRVNPTRLSSLKHKVKNVTSKKFKIYAAPHKTEDTEALRR